MILQAHNISKKFTQPAEVEILKGIDLSVQKGETVAIMGRSGQGKSTLLHVLGTLEPPSSGKLIISNQTVNPFNKSRIRNKHIAFVFQSFHLMEDYTALENILMPARIARRDTSKGSETYRTAYTLLETVGLVDRAHFNTKLLSGGEKQRIAIARALCNDPEILFADEPSGNLDRQTSSVIHELLLGFAKRSGKTLIVVTHDHELANLCDRKLILENGHLQSP